MGHHPIFNSPFCSTIIAGVGCGLTLDLLQTNCFGIKPTKRRFGNSKSASLNIDRCPEALEELATELGLQFARSKWRRLPLCATSSFVSAKGVPMFPLLCFGDLQSSPFRRLVMVSIGEFPLLELIVAEMKGHRAAEVRSKCPILVVHLAEIWGFSKFHTKRQGTPRSFYLP